MNKVPINSKNSPTPIRIRKKREIIFESAYLRGFALINIRYIDTTSMLSHYEKKNSIDFMHPIHSNTNTQQILEKAKDL